MKVNQIKGKVAAKVAKAKEKVEKKCGKAKACAAWLVATAAMAAIVGCQSPAQRAQTAEVNIVVEEGGTANFGNEFVSLAQSNETGGNDAGLTATQTTDTKPEVAVGVGGSSAGVGSSGAAKQGVGAAIGAAADGIASLFGGSSGGDAKAEAPAAAPAPKGACTDGSCSEGACTDGSCEDGACSECTDGNCSE